ncbi:MAG: alpha-amylase family glycosyl hydrolase [Clostridia bacterium]|nr:alpha-amylase family glycosyl hydrolase [Clostridia bacterium]
MKLYHNSRDSRFRSPFGAVETGSTVTLRLDAEDCSSGAAAFVRVWCLGEEALYPMKISRRGKTAVCRAEITVPSDPCLLWYSFYLKDGSDEHWYVNKNLCGGEGGEANCGDENSYQITVYDNNFTVPEWFAGQVMYQIFPDRFFGVHENGVIEKSREEYIIHYDRYEHISFNPHPYEAGPACNDFYGGNIKGIIQKLPYIKSLGVGVIYLNPIFEAYSNHKYDTANYKRIDPMFGTEEDFSRLCKEAEKLGIRIILDGVFSHTGADSIYFNKYGNYGEGGAYRDENSPISKLVQL